MADSAPLMEVSEFHLNIGGEAEFLNALRKVHEAIQKTNWLAYYDIYELFNGGEQPMYVLVFPHKNWADFQPLEPNFPAMLEKAFGREEAASIMKAFNKTTRSQRSSVMASRPDLSYLPAAK